MLWKLIGRGGKALLNNIAHEVENPILKDLVNVGAEAVDGLEPIMRVLDPSEVIGIFFEEEVDVIVDTVFGDDS